MYYRFGGTSSKCTIAYLVASNDEFDSSKGRIIVLLFSTCATVLYEMTVL